MQIIIITIQHLLLYKSNYFVKDKIELNNNYFNFFIPYFSLPFVKSR